MRLAYPSPSTPTSPLPLLTGIEAELVILISFMRRTLFGAAGEALAREGVEGRGASRVLPTYRPTYALHTAEHFSRCCSIKLLWSLNFESQLSVGRTLGPSLDPAAGGVRERPQILLAPSPPGPPRPAAPRAGSPPELESDQRISEDGDEPRRACVAQRQKHRARLVLWTSCSLLPAPPGSAVVT